MLDVEYVRCWIWHIQSIDVKVLRGDLLDTTKLNGGELIGGFKRDFWRNIEKHGPARWEIDHKRDMNPDPTLIPFNISKLTTKKIWDNNLSLIWTNNSSQ